MEPLLFFAVPFAYWWSKTGRSLPSPKHLWTVPSPLPPTTHGWHLAYILVPYIYKTHLEILPKQSNSLLQRQSHISTSKKTETIHSSRTASRLSNSYLWSFQASESCHSQRPTLTSGTKWLQHSMMRAQPEAWIWYAEGESTLSLSFLICKVPKIINLLRFKCHCM